MNKLQFSITMCLALAAMACGNKEADKEARCSSVCTKMRDEDLAKCADEACRKSVDETFQSCKSLCKTVAKGPPKSMNEQADDAEAACSKGDMEKCATIGGAYLTGKGGKTKDEKKGIELATKACTGGAGFGCEIVGRAHADGRGIPVNKDEAKTWFQKGCDLGAGGACRSLSLTFETSDPARIPLLEKACSKDDKIGCMGLGAAYLHGNQGAPKDLAKAKQFLQKSCDLGLTDACESAREIKP
jgi:TPR repeat protein